MTFDTERMIVDTDLIKKLLYDSGKTQSLISKETGVSQSLISRLISGEKSIARLSVEVAAKLTVYEKKNSN